MVAVFIQTSPDSYDRHNYRLILKDGDSIHFDNYEDAQNYWHSRVQLGNLDSIEVLDKPKQRTKAKGF